MISDQQQNKGENKYLLAKGRGKQSRDFKNACCVKDKERRVLTKDK